MADERIFILDDDDGEELGGFNDPVIPEPEEEPEKEDIEQKDGEKEEEDPEAEGEPEKEKAEEPKAEPEQNKGSVSFDQVVGMVTKQNEQIQTLVDMNKRLQDKALAPEPEVIQPPEKPEFTQEQWDDDPEGCSNAMYDYREALKEYDSKLSEAEEQEKTQVSNEEFKKSVDESWGTAVDLIPELTERDEAGNWKYPNARKAWAVVYESQETGYQKDPNGPLKAAIALRKHMKENGLSFQGQTEEEKPPAVDPEEERKRGAEEEAARQKRVKAGTMHTGSKGGGQKSVQLSAEQRSICKKMNISEDAYAASLAAMGGK